MKRIIGKVVFIGIILGIYFLVSQFYISNDFEDKSLRLMKERGAKIMEVLNKIPGCADRYSLQSTSFEKSWVFSKNAEGRLLYIDNNNSILDIKWDAEIIDNGRSILVQPKDPTGLQSRITGLIFSSCRAL